MSLKRTSLLIDLNVKMIQDIIIEQELKSEGYKFIYVIDPFDFINYCYPLGLGVGSDIRSKFDNYTTRYFSEVHIALDYIFDKDKSLNLKRDYLLFPEYGNEIESLRKLLSNQLTDANYYKKFIENPSEIEDEEIRKQLPNVLSMALGFTNAGFNKYSHFDAKSKESQSDITGHLKKLIEREKGSDLSIKFFEFIRGEYFANRPISPESVISKAKDCQVADRIIKINEKMVDYGEKTLLLYLSSTNLNRKLFNSDTLQKSFPGLYYFNKGLKVIKNENDLEVLNKLEDLVIQNEDDLEEPNKLQDSKKPIFFNPLRSVSQIFAQYVCDDDIDEEKKYSNLRDLEMIIIKKETNKSIYKNNMIEFEQDIVAFDNKINSIIQEQRKSIRNIRNDEVENSSMILKFRDLESQIGKMLSNNSYANYHSLFNDTKANIDSEIELANNNRRIGLKKVIAAYDTIPLSIFRNYYSSSHFNEGQNANKYEYFDVQKGNDKIESRDQHLPVHLNFTVEIYQQKIHLIFDYILDPFPHTKAQQDKFMEFIDSEINDIYDEENVQTMKYYEKQLFTNIFWIILNPILKADTEIKVLEQIERTIEKFIDQINGKTLDSIETQYRKDLLKEYRYVGSWIARRQQKFDKAEYWANLGLRKNQDDPRFYHSLCLVYYNLAEESIGDLQIDYLEKSIQNCDEAIKFFRMDRNGFKHVKRGVNVLNNTKIYILTMLYEIQKDEDKLTDARILLKELKSDLGENYKLYTEYLHTEAYLELMEFENSYDDSRLPSKERIEICAKKIIYAYSTILKAKIGKNVNTSSDKYKKEFDKIKNYCQTIKAQNDKVFESWFYRISQRPEHEILNNYFF